MLFITSVFLLAWALLIIYTTKEFFLSPALLFTGTFFLGVFICLINKDWDFDISAETAFLICIASAAFSAGHFLVNRTKLTWIRIRTIRPCYYEGHVRYQERKGLYWSAVILQMIILILHALFIIRIGGAVSSLGLIQARKWLLTAGNSVPDWLNHFLFMSQAIAMGYIYLFVYYLWEYKKKEFRFLIPSVLYIITQILTTNRSGIIFFLGAAMLITLTMTTKRESVVADKRRIIRRTAQFGILVLILFIGLGSVMGKTQYFGAWNMIAIYFGGSIYGLEYFVQNISDFTSPAWGYNCFPILNSVKRVLGISNYVQEKNYFPFIEIPVSAQAANPSATNLYTCLTIPACDFGRTGMILFYLFLGIFYAYIYVLLKRKSLETRQIVPEVIYLGYFMMPVFCAEAQYTFGARLFAPMSVYQLFYIFIFIKFWIKNVPNRKEQ